jgi:hypothetical protein
LVVDTLVVDTLVVDTLVVDTLVVDTLVVAYTLRPDISGVGTDPAHRPWLGVEPPCTLGPDFTRAHSPWVDTGGISGMAVGGITALARAGYGRTITASMCGPATKVPQRQFGDPNWSSQLSWNEARTRPVRAFAPRAPCFRRRGHVE